MQACAHKAPGAAEPTPISASFLDEAPTILRAAVPLIRLLSLPLPLPRLPELEAMRTTTSIRTSSPSKTVVSLIVTLLVSILVAIVALP